MVDLPVASSIVHPFRFFVCCLANTVPSMIGKHHILNDCFYTYFKTDFMLLCFLTEQCSSAEV